MILINTQRGQGLFMNDINRFWGLCYPSLVMSPWSHPLSYPFMLQNLWHHLLAKFCHLFQWHLRFVVAATSLVDSPLQERVTVLITKLGSLSSAVLQCCGCLVSSSLHPLATGYSGYPPARNTEISDPRHGAAVRPRSPASPELRLSVTHQ